jgi:hypothetical protein
VIVATESLKVAVHMQITTIALHIAAVINAAASPDVFKNQIQKYSAVA